MFSNNLARLVTVDRRNWLLCGGTVCMQQMRVYNLKFGDKLSIKWRLDQQINCKRAPRGKKRPKLSSVPIPTPVLLTFSSTLIRRGGLGAGATQRGGLQATSTKRTGGRKCSHQAVFEHLGSTVICSYSSNPFVGGYRIWQHDEEADARHDDAVAGAGRLRPPHDWRLAN